MMVTQGQVIRSEWIKLRTGSTMSADARADIDPVNQSLIGAPHGPSSERSCRRNVDRSVD